MKYLVLLALIMISPPSVAEDSGGSSSGSGSSGSDNMFNGLNVKQEMRATRKLLKERRYKPAIRKLNSIVRQDRDNADAWNLLGYSQRKIGKYKKAKKSYAKALKYNPEHIGALEYQGELFIILKDREKARGNLEKLKVLCPSGCEELADLTEALKSNDS